MLDTSDDIQTLNQLTIPVARKIQFELLAEDVLHSLWIPNLRLKQDAVPGRTIRGWFEATKEGTYPIACAELCGSGHGTMKGELHVLGPPDYEKWLKENSPQSTEVSSLGNR
jgi:cytochrome c oxidase subunit 2